MRIKHLAIAGLIIGLSGCNIVYKQSIQQGNAIEQDDLQQLQLGMTKSQVRLVMGTPAIQDPFHIDRWDYVYTFAPRGKKSTQRMITLVFNQGQLAAIEGDIDDPFTRINNPENQEDKENTEESTSEVSSSDSTSLDTAETATASTVTAVVPVVEAAIEEAPQPQAASAAESVAAAAASAMTWTVQLGVFAVLENAESLRESLRSEGIDTQIQAMGEEDDRHYRVHSGAFDQRDQAQQLRDEIAAKADIEGYLFQVPRAARQPY